MKTLCRFGMMFLLTTFALAILPAAHGNDFTDWLLGKNHLGSNHCTWNGCRECSDYCPKPCPCVPNVPTCVPGAYCKKQPPCVPEVCPSVCPSYCPKPWPCLWKSICNPFAGWGNSSPDVLPEEISNPMTREQPAPAAAKMEP